MGAAHQALGPVGIILFLLLDPPVQFETVFVVRLPFVVEPVDHLVTQCCAAMTPVNDTLWKRERETLAKEASDEACFDQHLVP